MARNRVWQMDLIDAHRAGRITDEELLQAPTGVSRRASLRTCPCHQPILVGLDADRCALAASCDPYPLTPAGEVWALTDGRRTYLLAAGQLHPRDRWNIPGHPPDDATRVLAEHRCGTPVPDEHRAPPPPAPPAPAEVRF